LNAGWNTQLLNRFPLAVHWFPLKRNGGFQSPDRRCKLHRNTHWVSRYNENPFPSASSKSNEELSLMFALFLFVDKSTADSDEEIRIFVFGRKIFRVDWN
ncbi:MAG: hypothetical protein ABFD18_07085, partial [Syntrophomonas sp.]